MVKKHKQNKIRNSVKTGEEVILFAADHKRKKRPYILYRLIGFVRNIVILTLVPLQIVVHILLQVGIISRSLVHVISSIFEKFLSLSKKHKRSKKRKKTLIYKPTFFYKVRYVILGVFLSAIFIFFPIISLIFVSDLPNPQYLSMNYVSKTTKILDRNGILLYEIYANQNRTIVRLKDIPRNLKNATIAIEDKNFYRHPGFDVQGIIRALISDIQQNDLQGGSTITQQLIKSAFLNPAPNLLRKLREVVLAFWAERIYSKDQIIELYFNYVPYGGTAWGVQAASEVYFGKKVSDLTLSEAAFLAGLPRAPSIYSPFANDKKLWRKRQKDVLDAMVRLKYVTRKEAEDAYKSELIFRAPQTPIRAPHFVMYVRDLLIKKYGINEVERGGLIVKTSLDISKQETIERIVKNQVETDSYLNIQNGAALITTPHNGDILAMIGSKNYFDNTQDGNVNITTSLRQPGSTIKLITYTLALSSGFTEATILEDSPLTISVPGGPSYSPVNYDGIYRGKLPLRLAFANSLNIPAVRIAQKLGADSIRSFGEQMGISSWRDIHNYGISITLGGSEVTMLDLATAYGTIANKGQRVFLDPILEIKNSQGKVINRRKSESNQVVNSGIAFIISDILSDNNARSMAFGANSPLNIPGKKISVKTGTTDNKRDNWTVGFTPKYVVATWVGNNDNTPMSPFLTSGITGAAPMWNKIMQELLKDENSEDFEIPNTIVKKNCYGRDAYFVRGTETFVPCGGFTPFPTQPFR